MDAEKVLEAMKEAGKPVRPGDIAKMLGVDSKEVSKAIKELKERLYPLRDVSTRQLLNNPLFPFLHGDKKNERRK